MLQNPLTGEPPLSGGVEPCSGSTPPYPRGLIRSQRNLMDKSESRIEHHPRVFAKVCKPSFLAHFVDPEGVLVEDEVLISSTAEGNALHVGEWQIREAWIEESD